MSDKKISVNHFEIGNPGQFVFIGGPCVIESEESALRHAEAIAAVAGELKIPFVFKASYDKANRTSVKSYRGPGIEKGLKILAKVKRDFRLPVLSDVHACDEIARASEVLDILQIPAFLCRQTDLLVCAAKTGRPVNVKKGQFMSPWECKNIIAKLESAGCREILLTERGFSFGYQNLVTDFRSIKVMREFGYPVVYDATHSVQQPGGQGDASGGKSEFIPLLSRCAIAAGIDALFLEVHENPEAALSDGPNSFPLKKLKPLLAFLKRLHGVVSELDEVTL